MEEERDPPPADGDEDSAFDDFFSGAGTFEVSFLRNKTYFDNEDVVGLFTAHMTKSLHVAYLRARVQCRSLGEDSYGLYWNECLYRESKTLARDFTIEAGESKYEFLFTLPENMPASCANLTGASCIRTRIVWSVKIKVYVPIDANQIGSFSVAEKEFRKGSLFQAQPELEPKAKVSCAPTGIFANKEKKLYLQCGLSRNVYERGEHIVVNVRVRNLSGMEVKSVVATVLQKSVLGAAMIYTTERVRKVDESESTRKCPIKKGEALTETMILMPRFVGSKDYKPVIVPPELVTQDEAQDLCTPMPRPDGTNPGVLAGINDIQEEGEGGELPENGRENGFEGLEEAEENDSDYHDQDENETEHEHENENEDTNPQQPKQRLWRRESGLSNQTTAPPFRLDRETILAQARRRRISDISLPGAVLGNMSVTEGYVPPMTRPLAAGARARSLHDLQATDHLFGMNPPVRPSSRANSMQDLPSLGGLTTRRTASDTAAGCKLSMQMMRQLLPRGRKESAGATLGSPPNTQTGSDPQMHSRSGSLTQAAKEKEKDEDKERDRKKEKEKEGGLVLMAPSLYYEDEEGILVHGVSYCVEVKLKVKGGKNLVAILPFTLSDQPEDGLLEPVRDGVREGFDTAHFSCTPVLEPPPRYSSLARCSLVKQESIPSAPPSYDDVA
eukprot:comp11775_c0_seq1/m.6373 comp11775_c0_seq1/g.6373  ORF comp11775_c0_seq1/g.6373 comp11775_c0_seq1/m.6373 type:complete len:672 (-) comp11775_c0_seq1:747-2762(-)